MLMQTPPVLTSRSRTPDDLRLVTEQRRRSHYHLQGELASKQPCQGLACFVAGGRCSDGESKTRDARIYCLGKCYAGPACTSTGGRPHLAVDASRGVILPRVASGGARTVAEYVATDGYKAAAAWLHKPPGELNAEVEKSGLRGRGGAGFPAAIKWRAVAASQSPQKYVVVNADEGDPGAYIDRFLLEDDPHSIIEACVLAGHAVGASRGIVYLRKEYPDAHRILASAIAEARAYGWLGSRIAGSSFDFDLTIFSGEGSYVCGEETALLNSIEGGPPMVRPRPPYPTEKGLFGQPTLVNNVETLASIPWILKNGGDAYDALGFSRSRGTKVVSLNSLFRRPGLYEVEFGVPVRHIVEDLGGGLKQGELRGLIIGGPLAGVLPPHLLDTPFGFEELQQVGASVGHGGIVAFNERISLLELMRHVFSFAAYESCGKCTPCRVGSRVVEKTLDQVIRAISVGSEGRTFASDVVSALHATSLCGLGTGLADFARSVMRYYPEEVARAFNLD